MPYRNKDKILIREGLYHAYNRSFEKREIFLQSFDYEYFMRLIQLYTEKLMDFDIHAFCLMPNHYHFLIHQHSKYAISRFFNIINSRYTRYFNKKYNREGLLWQGTYKANKIDSGQEYNTIIYYIHKNPLVYTENITRYPYSSYGHYLGKFYLPFIKKGSPPELL